MAAPSKEGAKHTKSLRDFKGVNTQAARQNIGDDEFAWLENVMPVGFGNLRALPGPSAALATWAPDVAFLQQSFNLNGTDYMFVLTTNGAAYKVNLSNNAVTKFANAATFNGSGTALAQWRNTQICIIDPSKGYFTYDGTTLTKWTGTLQSLTIAEIGIGYTSVPAISIAAPGGSGVTATASAHIQVGLATQSAQGTGYVAGDILTIAGGTVVSSAQIKVATVDGAGKVTGFNLIYSGDYTVPPANPAAVTGGYGTGATFTLNFGIGPVTLTNIGSGYSAAPAVTVTGGGGAGGTVTSNLTVVPGSGTSIATYAGRVWIGSNRTVVFSAPGSFNDFTTGNAGGSFVVIDEALHSSIQSLVAANNFLYLFGTTSVNVLSGVTVVNGETVFSNTNISAAIGSSQPYSVTPYYRAMSFATPYGFYELYGTTPQKISDALDGVFPAITGAIPVSAGVVEVFNLLCLCFMFQYNDPVSGPRTLIAVFFNKKWLFTSQGDNLTLMTTALVGGVPTLYGTDGTSLFQLLSDVNGSITQTIKTKLWDMGQPTQDKQVLKFGLETITSNVTNSVSGTVDTEIDSNNSAFNLSQGNVVTWVNNLGQTVVWTNGLGQTVTWLSSGYNFEKVDAETTGKYIGVTLTGIAPQQIYNALHLQYELRAMWTSLP